MQCDFIKTCTALSVVGIAGTAFAGGGERFDVSFSDVDIFNAALPVTNIQTVDTAGLGGRYFASFGYSNVDIDVCWNTGSTYSGWASEIQFIMEMEDGTTAGDGALFFVAPSPFAGDDTGSDVEGACSNRQALDEVDNPFPAFTFQVANDGLVECGIAATWDDGTGLRHSFCNTASYYFTLGVDVPAGCVGATGDCALTHPEPGCNDLTCCANTCDVNQGGDPFCCDSSWDSSCVELAIAICGIFQYSCDAPAGANDCVTSPTMMNNGDSVAFNTTGFNTDGPPEAGCGSGYDDLPIWSDAWYMVEVDADSNLTATCCLAADFDTKIAIYDAGAIGSVFSPGNLPDAFVVCNEDCDDPDFFSSEAIASVVAGNQYLIRVGGFQSAVGSGTLTVSWQEPDPPIAPQTCDGPGPDSFSQTIAGSVVQDNGVACAGGGITTENAFCRVYSSADLGGDVFSIDCITFDVSNSGSYLPAKINLLTTATGNPAPYGDMTLLASNDFGLYQNVDLDGDGIGDPQSVIAAFDGGVEVDLSDGSSLVIELEIPQALDGFAAVAGGSAADVNGGTTYIRSASCGITEYATYGSIGFDVEWFASAQGTLGGGGTPCPADFNGDGIVDGADFGTILAEWGPCSGCDGDLDGNGEVNGADVGQILAAWGVCAP